MNADAATAREAGRRVGRPERGEPAAGPVGWAFDPSAPLVTPQQNAEYVRLRRGLSDAEGMLPPTLVATFQEAAWHRLAAACGIPDAAGHGPEIMPVAGCVDGVPVAAVRMMVGAPAAALSLEAAIARGVRDILVVGSAGSLHPDLPIGGAVLVGAAEREDGTSHHYLPAGEAVESDPASLLAAADAVLACAAGGADPGPGPGLP